MTYRKSKHRSIDRAKYNESVNAAAAFATLESRQVLPSAICRMRSKDFLRLADYAESARTNRGCQAAGSIRRNGLGKVAGEFAFCPLPRAILNPATWLDSNRTVD